MFTRTESELLSESKKNCPKDYIDVLIRLNDLATNPKLQDRFLSQNGVENSLLRESSAEKALKEAADLLETNRLIENNLSFTYYTDVPYMQGIMTKFSFNFNKNLYLPYRINALVGKNGTGKTQVLTNLANHLSGLLLTDGNFEDKRPPFYKVISISYSAFDSFKVKRWENIKWNNDADENAKSQNLLFENKDMQSYVYCGIQSEQGTLSLDSLKKNFQMAFSRVNEKNRISSWEKIMREVMEAEHIKVVEKVLHGESDEVNWSSGQHILICTLTEVLANIENESIILFDEPEIHLHPNAISNTIRMLNKLLEEYNSYAIIATHSPLIVQEIPSRYIQILERESDVLTVRRPSIECFGENTTQITSEVFDVRSRESNYRMYLRYALDNMPFEDVVNLFDNKLSFNALLYLQAYAKEMSGDNINDKF